jgi:hypothetical protein
VTGQDLLNAMEVLNQELQLQTSEEDSVRGLSALNMAQDYFEDLAAQEGEIKGDSTANITSVASTETTAFPTGFLRINRIQFVDPVTSLPTWDLENIQEAGGHVHAGRWPWNVVSQSSPGIPDGYYTNGRLIYWSPLPDAAHTFRVYGFKRADDITSGGTFSYEDSLRLPLASFAVRLLRIGVGDESGDVAQVAKETLGAAVGALAGTNRDGASSLIYRYRHES